MSEILWPWNKGFKVIHSQIWLRFLNLYQWRCSYQCPLVIMSTWHRFEGWAIFALITLKWPIIKMSRCTYIIWAIVNIFVFLDTMSYFHFRNFEMIPSGTFKIEGHYRLWSYRVILKLVAFSKHCVYRTSFRRYFTLVTRKWPENIIKSKSMIHFSGEPQWTSVPLLLS